MEATAIDPVPVPAPVVGTAEFLAKVTTAVGTTTPGRRHQSTILGHPVVAVTGERRVTTHTADVLMHSLLDSLSVILL